jgi:LysM repeat protein
MQNVHSTPKNLRRPLKRPSMVKSKHRKVNFTALWVSLCALAIILPLVLISGTIIYFQVFQFNLPGVYVFDKNVELMSREETEVWIDTFWNENRSIHIISSEDPNISYWLTPQDLGLWVNPQATAKLAYEIGRTSDPLPDIINAASGQPQIIMPVLHFNNDAARQTLEILADELLIPPTDASVAFQEGNWIALPGAAGQSLDIDTIQSDLSENAFSILLTQTITLPMASEAPQISDLSPVLDEIEATVEKDLRLEAYDPITDEMLAWSVPTTTKLEWVTIDPKSYEVQLSFDPEKIEAFLTSQEQNLDDGRTLEIPINLDEMINLWHKNQPIRTTIRHAPTTYLVGAGESLWSISLKLGMPMWLILDANDGLTTNNLEAGMSLIIPSKNDLLPLPVIPNKRIVIDISTQRMIVYENGQVRNTHVISTGMSDSPTMAGIFQVQTHVLNAYASNWDLYMPHFLGIYEAWPGFMNGIHGLPLLSNGHRLWASNLGTPASYGCIILDLAAAEDLYSWAEPGVVVEIID